MKTFLVYYISVVIAGLLMFILGVLSYDSISDIFENINKLLFVIWLIIFIPPLAILLAIFNIIIYILNK